MKDYYNEKTAIVTGAASGIGLGMSQRMAELGARVYMADIDYEKLSSASAQINEKNQGQTIAVKTDVTKQEEVYALVRKAQASGHVHFLFNNAGVGATMPVEQLTFDDWRCVFDVNLWSTIYGIYAVLPAMRMQGFGHIINTSSIAGIVPAPYQELYSASKYAVSAIGQCLRYELWDENIRFSTVCPGNVATSIFTGLSTLPDDVISVDDAVDIILTGVANNENLIIFPDKYREMWEKITSSQDEQERIMLELARERKHNYVTRGRYF